VNKFLNDKTERLSLIIFLFSSIVFIFSLCNVQIIKYFDIGLLGTLLKSDGIKTITGGMISAYIFYILIELIPRYKKEEKALKVLNQAIASIVEGFFSPHPWQHAKSIRHINFELKTSINQIIEAIDNIRYGNVFFAQLNITMQTADLRYSDFQHLLALAITISPKHTLFWLDLTDKIRLLKDEMSNQIANPDMNVLDDLRKININVAEMNPTELFCSGVKQCVMEFFESVVAWNEL
jgi:hypothetical protein